jgi:hypothetical protein
MGPSGNDYPFRGPYPAQRSDTTLTAAILFEKLRRNLSVIRCLTTDP